MSNKKLRRYGNDTIDRYPPAFQGELTKILCITEEVFKNLKATLAEFWLKPKTATSKPKSPFRQKPLEKWALTGSGNDNHNPKRDKCISSFEPTNIFNTRNSVFWRLRNFRTWFKEQAAYEDSRYIEYYPLNL